MSKTNHTPGPWYLRTNRHTDSQGNSWGWLDAAPPGGQQRTIPGVNVTWTDGSITKANARLIAAAPEMLAACEAFVVAWEKSHQLEKTDVAMRMARIAIAKARCD